MATKKKSLETSEYIFGADEVMDSSTLDPSYGPEDNTKVLVGLKRKSDGKKYAVELETYNESSTYKGNKYEKLGAVIRNEDEYIDILVAPDDDLTFFATAGKEDIPENDKRRRNYTNPTFTELNGKENTQFLSIYHNPKVVGDHCAVCACLEYGDGEYWLPAAGEYGLVYKYISDVNAIMSAIGAKEIAEEEYWTSTQFSDDYAYSFNITLGEYHFWHCKKTVFGVRPMTSSEDFIYIEN